MTDCSKNDFFIIQFMYLYGAHWERSAPNPERKLERNSGKPKFLLERSSEFWRSTKALEFGLESLSA